MVKRLEGGVPVRSVLRESELLKTMVPARVCGLSVVFCVFLWFGWLPLWFDRVFVARVSGSTKKKFMICVLLSSELMDGGCFYC